MKSKYTLLTLTFTALFCSLTSGQDVSKEIIASSRLPTVKIQTNTSSGTGFFISADLILTCYHVVGGIKRDTSGKVLAEIFQNITGETLNGENVCCF